MNAVTLALFVAQAVAPAVPAPEGDRSSLARIRKRLAEDAPPPITATTDRSGDQPVFRMRIKGFDFKQPIWDTRGPVPSYVRPDMPIYHYEFLKQVTSEAFRASALYPNAPESPFGGVGIGIPVLTVVETATQVVKGALRHVREQRARDEVRDALRTLEEQRRRQLQSASDKKQ